MTSAPSGDQIRLFSSVALENAEKLMLAASCSAADAMCPFPNPKRAYAKPLPPQITLGRRRCFTLRLALAPTLRLFFLRLGSSGTAENDDFSAGRFDGRDGCLGGARHLDCDRRAEAALGQQPDAVARPAQDTRGHQLLRVEAALGGELAGIERLLQPAEVHDLEVFLKDLVVEAALRQPPVQRGLPAFEAVQRDAGARG